MINLYNAIILLTEMTLALTVVDLVKNRLMTRKVKRAGIITCLIIGTAALCECIGEMLGGSAGFVELHVFVKLMEFCIAPLIGVAVSLAYGVPVRLRAALVFVAAHAVFQMVSLPQGLVFTIDSSGDFHRGSLFIVYVVFFAASIIYAFVSIILLGRKYQKNPDFVLFCNLILLAEGISQLFSDPVIRVAYICIAAANLLVYMNYYKTMLRVDSVTELLNRRCYDSSLENIPVGAVVVLFDIDDFKSVNDTYGHHVGDYCLRKIAENILKVYKKYGNCYRIGGDEFCAMVLNGNVEIRDLNKEFEAEISRLQEEDARIPGVAIGYEYYDYGKTSIRNVVREADEMLYRNKREKKEVE